MSSNQPTRVLITLLKKQMKLEDELASLTEYVTAATTCLAASAKLKSYIKLEDTYGLDASYRDPITSMRERVLAINDELRLLAIRKKVWRDRDSE